MPKQPDANGAAFLRTYRTLDGVVTNACFADVCEAQDLPRPAKRMFEHVRSLYRDGQPSYIPMNPYDQMRKSRREQWTQDRVNDLIAARSFESERLEFKQEIGSDKTAQRPWAAMANAGGGDVIYGIAEVDGRADHILRILFDGVDEQIHQRSQEVDPPVHLTITRVALDGDDGGVVCVRVSPSVAGTVHLFKRCAPIRSATTTRYMTSEEIRRWSREAKRPAAPDL